MERRDETEPKEPLSNDLPLSRKQIEAIPHLIGCRSLEEGCRLAKLSKATLYKWLKQDNFRIELSTARDRLIGESLERLKARVCGAIDGLIELSEDKEKWIRLNAIREILNRFFQITEINDLKKRIETLEERLTK